MTKRYPLPENFVTDAAQLTVGTQIWRLYAYGEPFVAEMFTVDVEPFEDDLLHTLWVYDEHGRDHALKDSNVIINTYNDNYFFTDEESALKARDSMIAMRNTNPDVIEDEPLRK